VLDVLWLHVRGEWHDHTYDMQHVYRRIQVHRNIHQDGMYRWNVLCVWRRPVQHLRRWKIFVRGPRSKLRRSHQRQLRSGVRIQSRDDDSELGLYHVCVAGVGVLLVGQRQQDALSQTLGDELPGGSSTLFDGCMGS
jgi:hypothetical protein